jgi:hypothetical protein
MITYTLILFLFASGEVRSINGTDAQCQVLQQMLSDHKLLVDDIDLPRQEPVEVTCLCAGIEVDGVWE